MMSSEQLLGGSLRELGFQQEADGTLWGAICGEFNGSSLSGHEQESQQGDIIPMPPTVGAATPRPRGRGFAPVERSCESQPPDGL